MAEFNSVSDISHVLESIFIRVLDGRLNVEKTGLHGITHGFDLLHSLIEKADRQYGRDQVDAALIELRKFSEGQFEDSDTLRVDVESAVDKQPNSAVEAEHEAVAEADVEVAANLPVAAQHEEKEADPRSVAERQQEVIRVRSNLLDNLVNSAGEVSIYRARIEEQVSGFGNHLDELGQTILRLKSQLRNLESETDAQIRFSHKQSESELEEAFDPLEMDRYTAIQELSRSLGESVEDLTSLQGILSDQVRDSETLLLQQSRLNTELQDGLIRTRMVQFQSFIPRIRRIVRQASEPFGKRVEVEVSGAENEIDNKVLDRMISPIEHILRNAVAHGVETQQQRIEAGKPETATISVNIDRDGSDVLLSIADNGRGLDLSAIKAKAIANGLVRADAEIEDQEWYNLILEPGFSTATEVTQLSGRGVGLDVVNTEIKQLGGVISIESEPGVGTRFIARLPFTLAINRAILVQVGEELYAIPMVNIDGISRIPLPELAPRLAEDHPQMDFAAQQYDLYDLATMLQARGSLTMTDDAKKPVIFLRAGETHLALMVDLVLGNREIVVKSLGKQLSQVKSLAGASILPDGRVVLILDLQGLLRASLQRKSSATEAAIEPVPEAETEPAASDRPPLVMVVDDSITMRRVATKLLNRHHFEVVSANDGIDALDKLEDYFPDVMLLDIEMPRMDGFELATQLRSQAATANLPIIMVTSRTGDKHRQHATDIGVNRYMGKPYQEADLIENIRQLLPTNSQVQ